MVLNSIDFSAENVTPPATLEATSASIQLPPEQQLMDPETPANA